MAYRPTVTPKRPNIRFPSPGVCIYCGAPATKTNLTDEHIVPFSLGGNDLIEKASCRPCADIVSKIEQHVARNVFGTFRIRTGTQTRRPKERPSEFLTMLHRPGSPPAPVKTSIKGHAFFLVVPRFRRPSLLREEPPTGDFGMMGMIRYPFLPTDYAEHGENLKTLERFVFSGKSQFNPHKFGRVIAKIAYAQAVAWKGLDGIRWHPDLVNIILGKSINTPYLVGCEDGPIPPFDDMSCSWRANMLPLTNKSGHTVLTVSVRIFAYAGSTTTNTGLPVYQVVVGEPLELLK